MDRTTSPGVDVAALRHPMNVEAWGAVPRTFVDHVRAVMAQHGTTHSYTLLEQRRDGTSEREMTFQELDELARRIAVATRQRTPAGGTALLLYPPGLAFLPAFLGCLYAGITAVPLPLPTADPRSMARTHRIIRDLDAQLLLTDAEHRSGLRAWLAGEDLDRAVHCIATDEPTLPDPGSWQPPPADPESVAYLQYTSGSTSAPRGVTITQGNMLANAHDIWQVIGRPREGIGVGWLPHYHDMGLVGQLLQPLYVGASLAFTSPLSFAKRPAIWLDMVTRYQAGYIVGPNFGYDWCTRQVTDQQLAALDLASLRVALTGAEPIRPDTLRAFADRFGPVGFQPQAWRPVYGMAEATLLVTGLGTQPGARLPRFDPARLEEHTAVPSDSADAVAVVSCGAPVSSEIRIVDAATCDDMPDGRVGEIWVRGPSVAAGYWQQPAATETTFQARTSSGDGPFLRTGDLGFVLDGELHVTGRLKELIILNGRNIYPQDVEEVARVHPALGFGAAFAVDVGHEQAVLVQEVRPGRLDGLSTVELTERIRTALADRLRLPVPNVVLVRAGGVQRTTSGKVMRARMRRLFLDGELAPIHAALTPALHDALRRAEPVAPGRGAR